MEFIVHFILDMCFMFGEFLSGLFFEDGTSYFVVYFGVLAGGVVLSFLVSTFIFKKHK